MPIGTIVTGIISALAWKASEKAAEKVGEKMVENRGAILEKVKGLLKGDELITLNLLEKYPASTDLQQEFAQVLTPRLNEQPKVAEEIAALLKEAGIDVQIKRNEMNISGDNNQAFQDISGSTITINK